MKYHYFAGALGLVACAAYAQSSVTLYGLIDVGLNYVNNTQTANPRSGLTGAHAFSMADGSTGVAGSRWGLRGVEDLGGGLRTIFVLENGFTINNGALGQGGDDFGRQAYVGLSGGFGTITLGRQYETYADFVQPVTAGDWDGYMGSHPDDVDSLANTSRINNAIKFKTPDYRGFSAAGLYSLGGVTGSLTQDQVWTLGAGYVNGPLTIGAGYMNARDPNISLLGNTPNKGPATVNNYGSFGSTTGPETSPVNAGYASAKTAQFAGFGVKYAFRPVTLGFVVTNTRFEGLGSSSGPNPLHYSGTAAFTVLELNLKSQITPALQLGSAVSYTQRNSVDGDGGAKYTQLDLGALYSFSKRTDVYLLGVFQQASGRDSLGQPAVASITGFNPSTTNHQMALRIALLHKF